MTKRFKELMTQLQESTENFSYAVQETLNEEFHPEITDILNSETDPKHKLNLVTKKLRELTSKGEVSGIEGTKPSAKGSSRAVFFSNEPETIHVDGQPTQVHTATKIAFAGPLDRYTGHSNLLGELQNFKEMDRYIQRNHSSMTPTDVPGHFKHNPLGIIPPVLDDHSEGGHWLKTIKLDKYSSKDMKEYTKNEDFPKGISHKDFVDTLEYHDTMAHGKRGPRYQQEHHDKFAKLSEHPFMDSAISFMFDSGMNPADLQPRNMGTLVHNGKRIPQILDWGYDDDIGKLYQKARKEKYKLRY